MCVWAPGEVGAVFLLPRGLPPARAWLGNPILHWSFPAPGVGGPPCVLEEAQPLYRVLEMVLVGTGVPSGGPSWTPTSTGPQEAQ